MEINLMHSCITEPLEKFTAHRCGALHLAACDIKKKNEKNWNRCWTHRQWLCIRYWNRRTSRENHAARNCTMVQINENTHIIQGGAVPLVYKGSFTAYDFEFRVQTQSRDLDQDLFPLWMHNITCLRGTIRRVRKDDMPSYLWNVGCILTSWATSLNLF